MSNLSLIKSEHGENNVTMSNALTRSSHALSLIEKRVIAAIIAKVDSRKGAASHAHLSEFQKIRLSALDYSDIYGVDPKHAYEHLRKAADNLFDRQFSIKNKIGKAERVTKYRWVSSATYAKDEGFIELSFTTEIYPHLNVIRNQYTTYKLKNASSFKSVYSWRLFEYAKSWLSYGKPVRITIENLQQILEWPESYKWHDAKKRALEPAIKEIIGLNELSMNITYKTEKKGRSIYAIEFIFKEG